MSPTPPALARRLLERAVRGDPAGPAILGDLLEDFARVARERGPAAARRWYLRQAVPLALVRAAGRGVGGALHLVRSTFLGDSDMTGPSWLRGLVQDGVYAARTLRRTPAFALFTAAVIGLGVGAATAVFSVLRPLVIAPLPFGDPDRLVWIANHAPPEAQASLSAVTSRSGNLRDFRARARSFDGITGFNAFSGAYALSGDGSEPERIGAIEVAHDFLQVLRVDPLMGRGFTEKEGAWGGPHAVVLSHGFWVRHFASERDIVGRTITLNEAPYEVVGVLPASFDFASVFRPGRTVDVLLPFPVADETDRWGNTMSFIGRLRPGVSAPAAQAELDALIAALEEEQPRRWGLGADLSPLREHVAGPFRPALMLLAGAAATLLLIVCVNVSNLILARAPGRAREVAVRKALGASRGRLVRQLVLETLAVALGGAALGAVLAWGATRFVARGAAIGIPLLDGVRVDAGALLFATLVAVTTGVVVGLLPAVQVSEGTEAGALRQGGRGASASRRARRLREVLVIAEVTLACVLVVAGGLLVRSFRAVANVDLGYRPENVAVWAASTSRNLDTQADVVGYYTALTDRVKAVPGVEAVGLSDAVPLRHNRTWGFQVVGRPSTEDSGYEFFPHVGDEGYRATMGIELLEGRDLDAHDTQDTQPVVLINESGARQVFPGEDAVGQHIALWDQRPWEIVGVVGDVRQLGSEIVPGVQVYFSYRQQSDLGSPDLVVRSRRPTADLATAVGVALHEVDPTLPTREYRTMQSLVDESMSARRFTLTILGAFGAAALLLAGLGIYGVLAYSVAERTPEIGIRMALGASAGGVVWSVLGRTLALTAVGIAVGAALSLGGGRLVGSLLFGVRATDPMTFVGMGLVLLAVAGLAGAIPALRAARTTGVRALRSE